MTEIREPRRRPLRVAALLAVLALVAGVLGPAPASYAEDDTVTVRLRAAVKQLPRAAETRAGYDRDKFTHWVDANGDCQDTRDEVLEAESLVATTGDCDITGGK